MKKILSLITIALAFSTAVVGQEAKKETAPKNNYKFYGFVRNYFVYDSRESISGTGDLFYYLPKDISLDASGEDINATSSFRYLSLTSRLGVDVTGYNIGNVHFSAKIEGDFYSGLSNSSKIRGPENFRITFSDVFSILRHGSSLGSKLYETTSLSPFLSVSFRTINPSSSCICVSVFIQ